jgi:hypothetical protein
LHNEIETERFVDLRELLEQTGKDNLVERFNVSCHVGIFRNDSNDRFDFLADTQRVEFDFEDIVKFADFRSDVA